MLSHDTILHRMLRPVAARLVNTPVSPDALTMLRLATGIGAAICFGCGGWMNVGAGLFLFSMLLDRADGELARQSGRFSRIGPNFDLISDSVVTMAIFVGLGIGAAGGLPLDAARRPEAGIVLGAVAAVSSALLFSQLNIASTVSRPTAGSVKRHWFDLDDMMLVVPLTIWCGHATWILLASGILTPLAAILVTVLGWTTRARVRRRLGVVSNDG